MKTIPLLLPLLVGVLFLAPRGLAAAEGTPPVQDQEGQAKQERPLTKEEFLKLVDTLDGDIGKILAMAGINPWTKDQLDQYRTTYPQAVAVWEGPAVVPGVAPEAPPRNIRRTVSLFSDPDQRQIAVIVQVVDDQGEVQMDHQQAINDVVARIVTLDKLAFQTEHPHVIIDDQRDLIPWRSPAASVPAASTGAAAPSAE